MYQGCKTMYEMLNFTYDSDVSPEYKFQNDFSFVSGSRGVIGKNDRDECLVLSREWRKWLQRGRGMSVKSEVGCLGVLKKCRKILADICEMALCTGWLKLLSAFFFLSIIFACCSWHVQLIILLSCSIYLLLYWCWPLRGVMSHFCYFRWAIIIRVISCYNCCTVCNLDHPVHFCAAAIPLELLSLLMCSCRCARGSHLVSTRALVLSGCSVELWVVYHCGQLVSVNRLRR